MDLTSLMKALLANTFSYYLKAQYYHWNVEGPDFKQYHDLFGGIYETVYGSVDKLAEEIRSLNAYAPGGLRRFAELSVIQEDNTIPSALGMAARLLSDNTYMLNSIKAAYDAAEAEGNHGLSNVLAELQDAHKKIGWMLTATLKIREVDTTSPLK